MRLLGKFLGGRLIITVIALGGAALFAFGPREPVDLTAPRITLGADLDQWLATREAVFDDIVPGTEKRIAWAGEPGGARTGISVVYLHGFSASSEELARCPIRWRLRWAQTSFTPDWRGGMGAVRRRWPGRW